MVEVAGGERPGEDEDEVGVEDVGVDDADEGADEGDDDHGYVDYVVDVGDERKKQWKWPEECERVKMMMMLVLMVLVKVMMISMMLIMEMLLMLMLNVRNGGSGCRRATGLCSNGN